MKLLIIDSDCAGLSIAWRAAQAGHAVKLFIEPMDSNNQDTGAGFKGVERIDNWIAAVRWADLIIATSNRRYIDRLERFRKAGFPVFGPSVASADLEIKRGLGMKILEEHGIKSAGYKTFPNVAAALKEVEKTGKRYVFKTLGDNEDKSLTYVSKHAADLVSWIEWQIDNGTKIKGEVMLQDFIDGIEMGISRFVGAKGFVGPWNESFEHPKLMSGDYGPNVGEMGTIAYFTNESKLGEETLAKLEKYLVGLKHTGDVALGFIIDRKTGRPYPTEWTVRFGWPIENLMLAATEGDPIAWMKDALDGKDTTTFRKDIGCCLVLAHGAFPDNIENLKEHTGRPIYGITRGNKKYIHPQAVKIDILPDMEGEKVIRRPVWNTTGGYVAVVTGFGKSVRQSADRAYKTIKQLHVTGAKVRDDVGEGLEKKLEDLHTLGYATHCNYE